MRVAILISTIDQGIERLSAMLLPQADDVCYVVSHQYTEERFREIPAELAARPDVSISQMAGKGLSRNRNNALRLCPDNADIALIADDDGMYTRKNIDDLIRLYTDNPKIDVACLMIKTHDGEPPYKNYLTAPTRIANTYQLYVTSPEISFRPARLRQANIKFDERFGAGTEIIRFGEESVLMADCLRAGLQVWFYPQYVVCIPYENTIKKMPRYDARRVRVLGAVDARVRGLLVATLKAFWFTLSNSPSIISEKHSPWRYLADRLSGVRYIAKTKRPTDDIL